MPALTHPSAWLQGSAEHLTLVDASGAPVGLVTSAQSLAAGLWREARPSPWQLEAAIDEVEAAIEALGWPHAARGVLGLSPELARGLPALALAGGEPLARASVERAFSDLASAAQRGPNEPAAAAHTGADAATLLLLRELMHHLGFEAVASPEGWPESASEAA